MPYSSEAASLPGLFTTGGFDTFTVRMMFTRTATGIALSGEGGVEVVELSTNLGGAASARFFSVEGSGSDLHVSWRSALAKAVEAGFPLVNPVVGVPAHLTYQKSMFLPFRGRRKISQILLPELEGELPVSAEAAVADFVATESGKEGTRAIAIACELEKLEMILTVLPEGSDVSSFQTDMVGLSSAALFGGVKNGVGVYLRGDVALLTTLKAGRPAVFRKLRTTGDSLADVGQITAALVDTIGEDDEILLACGRLTEPLIASLARAGVRNVKVPDDWDIFLSKESPDLLEPGRFLPAIGLALKGVGAREAIPFDLCQGRLKPGGNTSQLKVPALRTAVLLGLVIVLSLGHLFAGYTSAKSRYDSYSLSLRSDFEDLFPGTKVVSELAQLEEKLVRLEQRTQLLAAYTDGGSNSLSVLGELSRVIPESLLLKVNDFSLDAKRLRLEGTLPSFDAVEKLKVAVESSQRFRDVKVLNARVGADSSKVSFRLQMEVIQDV